MRVLSFAVAALSLVSGGVWWRGGQNPALLLALFGLVCAYTTFRSQTISAFLKILVALFAAEVVVFGGVSLISLSDYWPPALNPYKLPDSVALTVAMFGMLVWAVSHLKVVRTVAGIADRYFEAEGPTVARLWPFPRFQVAERKLALWMIVCLIVLNQAQVGINVRLSFFSRDWFNAIQNKDEATFWTLLFTVFLFWAVIYLVSAIIEIVVRAMLTIRWRRYLTTFYVSRWLDGATHYRMSLQASTTDNPDQRIAEDVHRFIDGGQVGQGVYSYSIILISTLSNLVSFAIILWTLSADFTLPGTTVAVPGFLFWMALVYSLIGTGLTQLIGRPLTAMLFERQRYEADFRFALARLREYSEQVALLKGEAAELQVSIGRFGRIYDNFVRIMHLRKKLTAFTALYGQLSPFIPYIVAAPFYFVGKIQLGVMTQTASAFNRVHNALDFFVNYYTSLADFRAVLDRLSGFDQSIEEARTHARETRIATPVSDGGLLKIEDLSLALPDGRTIVAGADLSFAPHQAVFVNGPSGSGKSTLFRAIAGIWPYGKGQINVPAGASVMLLPQKPYMPIGTLRAAVTYPGEMRAFDDSAIRAALEAAQLGAFIDRLDEEDNWHQRLSGGEQERLAIARALLAKPNWLFLDEATASLDERSEAAIYTMLAEKLPQTTIVSIGHRSTLHAFHKRHIALQPTADGVFKPTEIAAKTAAE